MISIPARVAGFFFPVTCSGCGVTLPPEDRFRVCSACVESIPLMAGLVCVHCGVPLPDGGASCFNCRARPPRHITAIRSCVAYEGLSRDLLKRFKYGNRDFLDRFLGRLLTAGYEIHHKLLRECDAIVPVPLHPLRRLFRGYNQAELLARVLSAHLGKPVIAHALRRTAYSRPQFHLNREERYENLKNVFSSNKHIDLKNRTILLVDDICTTGATLSYCAAALRRAGAEKVFGLTVARD